MAFRDERDDGGRAVGAGSRWSAVTAPGGAAEMAAQASLLGLCMRYRYPVYAYLRRRGHAPEAAQALTCAFFERLVLASDTRMTAAGYDRFRLFLLAELDRFLCEDLAAPMPARGLLEMPPLQQLEHRLQAEAAVPMPPGSPEQTLQRSFALEVMGTAHRRLRREACEAGQLPMFEALERFLGSEPAAEDYAQVAGRFAVRPHFISLAVQRLRQRFRELVDAELGETLVGSEALDAERHALWQALGSAPR